MIHRAALALLVPLCVFFSAPVIAQTPASACTYSSKTYSDGAFVCVQKSLMLKCAVDQDKAAWVVVIDKDLSEKCQVPAARGTIYQQRARWHRRNIAREIAPPTGGSPRCFHFNGKRYCE